MFQQKKIEKIKKDMSTTRFLPFRQYTTDTPLWEISELLALEDIHFVADATVAVATTSAQKWPAVLPRSWLHWRFFITWRFSAGYIGGDISAPVILTSHVLASIYLVPVSFGLVNY